MNIICKKYRKGRHFANVIQAGCARIEFLTKKQITVNSYQSIKTPTGYMNISIPEITALDLVRYAKSVGYLNLVATILSELHEKLDVEKSSNIFQSENLEVANIQRLGYLLELVEADEKIIELLKQKIKKLRPRAIPLRPDKQYHQSQKNSDWMLYINETIESDI